MKSKKITALLSAAALAFSALAMPTGICAEDDPTELFYDDFEEGKAPEGWTATNLDNRFEASNVEGFGNYSMTFEGAGSNLNRTNLKIYSPFTFSMDFYMTSLNAGFRVDLIRNGGNYNSNDRVRVWGKGGYIASGHTNTGYYLQANEKYHMDWVVDPMTKTYEVYVTGKVTKKNTGAVSDEKLLVISGEFADTTLNGEESPYKYSSGIYIVSEPEKNTTDKVYIDNLKLSYEYPKIELSGTPVCEDMEIEFATNSYFYTNPDTSKTGTLAIFKDGNKLEDGQFGVSWTKLDDANFSTGPTVQIYDGLEAGEYKVTFNGMKDMGKVWERAGMEGGLQFDCEFTVLPKGAEDPLKGVIPDDPSLKVSDGVISGVVDGYPTEEFKKAISSAAPGWTIQLIGENGMTVSDCIFGGQTLKLSKVIDGVNCEYEYKLQSGEKLFATGFNTAPAEQSLTKDHRTTTEINNMFPSTETETREVEAKPNNKEQKPQNNWNAANFQNAFAPKDGQSITKEIPDNKSDYALAFKSVNCTEAGNLQLLKDFYVPDDDYYPVAVNLDVYPDGEGTVQLNLKADYYNGEAKTASLTNLVTFAAYDEILSTTDSVSKYAPEHWYHVSIVLDKVVEDSATKKTAYVYINGERVNTYDFSDKTSSYGNENFYSLTLQEQSAPDVDTTTYFDNLSVTRLYNASAAPSQYIAVPEAVSNTYVIDESAGTVTVPEGTDPTNVLKDVPGWTKTVKDNDIIYTYGEHIQSFVVQYADPSELPSEQPSEQPSEDPSEQPSEQPSEDPSEQPSEQPSEKPSGELSATIPDINAAGSYDIVVNSVSDEGTAVVAVYGTDDTLLMLTTAKFTAGETTVPFELSEETFGKAGRVAVYLLDSLEQIKPLAEKTGKEVVK